MTVTRLRDVSLDAHRTNAQIDQRYGFTGPDALPTGTRREHVGYTGDRHNLHLADTGSQLAECLRQHTHAHLYDDSTLMARDMLVFLHRTSPDAMDDHLMTRALDDARHAMATELDVWDWDCTGCRRAVFTRNLTDACPNCGPR